MKINTTLSRFTHFIKVSITVYIFSMFVYSIWYFLQIIDLANIRVPNEWAGSLCYLPHGTRVLMICFFRYYALPGLYLAEISGPSLIHHEDYISGWTFAAIGSLLSVVFAVEVVKWTRVSPGKFSFFSSINFKNYKFLILVVIISALLNGLLVNLTISLINDAVTIDVITVFRFFIGDFIGASVLIFALWIIFSTLVDTRLIMTPDE